MDAHPVQRILLNQQNNTWRSKMQAIQVLYGAGAAMRMQTDKSILEKFERLPGLPSARVGLNTAIGRDEEFGFEDFLGGESP